MEVVNFEKFLYFNKCELNIIVYQKKRLEKQKSNFLFTLNSIYFLGDHPDNKSKGPEEVELEKNLIFKMNHEQFFISSYDDQMKNITFASRIEDVQIIIEIKDYPTKDFKDFVTVCLIFDGYKMITESLNLDYSSYLEYLLYLIENIITNSGSLVIDDYFFAIDDWFLSSLTNFFTRFEKMIIKVNLYDINMIKTFIKVFCEEDQIFFFLDEMVPNIPKLSLIKVLKINDNYLDDEGFEILSPFLEQAEFLTELEISKNHISNKSLMGLTKHITKGLRQLDKLVLSNNWIDSFLLDEFVKTVLENLPKLNLLDLSGNYIDNDFLRKFDMNYLRKVCTKYEFNEVLIDLTKNRFDTHLIRKNFYLWKPEEEAEQRPDKGIYTLDHFLQNIAIMKLKLKFKIDIIKHYKEVKDLEVYKKQMDSSKCVKVFSRTIKGNYFLTNDHKTEIDHYIDLFEYFYLVDQFFDPNLNNFNNKDSNQNINPSSSYLNDDNREDFYSLLGAQITQSLNSVNNFSYYNNNNHQQQLNNIQMFMTNAYYSEERNNIIKKLFMKEGEVFNPNVIIEHMNDFFIKLRSTPVEIPLTSVHKFTNRVKIETLLALRDKDIYSISYLSEICSFFKMSFMERIDTELMSLKEKTDIILNGLHSVLNFEGSKLENKYFFHEVNNFLDIFIKEADAINFKNDLVNTGKYVQFVRNNNLRSKLANIYDELLKEENLFSTMDNSANEFDLIYRKYKDIEDFSKLRVPEDVRVKSLCLHPLKLDYLLISESQFADLENDLKIVSAKLLDEESYGIRNIHDRIHFLFTTTSDETVDTNNKFVLHKQNNYLKTVRILFRYFNNLDLKHMMDKYHVDYMVYQEISVKENYSNHDRMAMINYLKLKSMPDKERKENTEHSIKEMLDFKKKITSFSIQPIKESLIMSEDLKREDEDGFNVIAMQINERLYETLDRNFADDLNTVVSIGQVCKNVKNFVMFYLTLKEQFKQSNSKLYDLINQEFVFQIYRYANRNDFTTESKIVQYALAILMIMSCYLELNSTLTNTLKKWLNYLIFRNYYAEFCKTIHKNLTTFNITKLVWIPSIFEIEFRMENAPVLLKIHFGKTQSEEFSLNHTTTVSDLYEKILNESKFFSSIIEKRLYWIYVKHININENVAMFNEEYVLEIISYLEENYLNNLDLYIESNTYVIKPTMTTQNKLDVEGNPTEGNVNETGISKTELGKQYQQSFIFNHIRFNVKRRLFSPSFLSAEFSAMNLNETFLLFEQLKSQFIKQEFSLIVSDGDSVHLCSILMEILRRNNLEFDNTVSIEENIEVNLHKVMPKFKRNVINNNLEKFITQVKKSMEDKNLAIKNEKDLKEQFLMIFKNYEIFFSNVYLVKTKYFSSAHTDTNIPEKFIVLVTSNFVIFLETAKYEPLFKFLYCDIIHCNYMGELVYLAVKLVSAETNESNEIRMRLHSEDSRCIAEDILSYTQLFLAVNTPSEKTNCKTCMQEDVLIEDRSVTCDMKDYKFVYQRLPPFFKIIDHPESEISANTNVIQNRRARASTRKSVIKNTLVMPHKFGMDKETTAKAMNNIVKEDVDERKSQKLVTQKGRDFSNDSSNNEVNKRVSFGESLQHLKVGKDIQVNESNDNSNVNKSIIKRISKKNSSISPSASSTVTPPVQESVAMEKTKSKLNLAFNMMPSKLLALTKPASTNNQLFDPTMK